MITCNCRNCRKGTIMSDQYNLSAHNPQFTTTLKRLQKPFLEPFSSQERMLELTEAQLETVTGGGKGWLKRGVTAAGLPINYHYDKSIAVRATPRPRGFKKTT